MYYLYSILDTVSGQFSAPVMEPNDGCAIRNFILGSGLERFGSYAKDFSLYRVGSYNNMTGEIEPCRLLVGNYSNLAQSQEVKDNEKTE